MSDSEVASNLKNEANALYRANKYEEAAKAYLIIIAQYENSTTPSFIRIIKCNLAACFIELGQFKNALVQLNEIFATKEDPDYNLSPPQAGEPIFQKARFRRARCYHEIGEHSAALGELNAYRDLAKSQIDLVEPQLRKKIEEVLKPYATEADISARQLTPFDYEVHVLPGNPSEKMTFVLKDLVPKEYCVPNPPRGPTTEFLTQLVTKHNHQFKKYIPKWTCWSCKKPADSLSHTPSTHLTLSPAQGGPKIIDYTLPVCERGGKCDKEAVTFMNEELTLMSRVMKN